MADPERLPEQPPSSARRAAADGTVGGPSSVPDVRSSRVPSLVGRRHTRSLRSTGPGRPVAAAERSALSAVRSRSSQDRARNEQDEDSPGCPPNVAHPVRADEPSMYARVEASRKDRGRGTCVVAVAADTMHSLPSPSQASPARSGRRGAAAEEEDPRVERLAAGRTPRILGPSSETHGRFVSPTCGRDQRLPRL